MTTSRGNPATLCVSLMDFDNLSEDAIQQRTLQMLFRSLNAGRMLAFAGSGLSNAYGYPGWDALVREVVRRSSQHADSPRDPDSLENYLLDYAGTPPEAARGGAPTTADRNLMVLDACADILTKRGESLQQVTRQALEDLRGNPSTDRPSDHDPLKYLIQKLRIRRFLTTNYDQLIEQALGRSPDGNEIERTELGIERPPLGKSNADHSEFRFYPEIQSLDADPARYDELVKFAVGAPGYEVGVFHCHGSTRPDSTLVVSERDYQNLYLRDQPANRTYRETLALAFAANPVLFVGLGMQEADLLRPLRQFVSEADEQTTHERPLFALWPKPETKVERFEFRRFLYRRYGVKVCYYSHEGTDDLTRALSVAIDAIARDWRNWWLKWQEKPPIRKPRFEVRGSAMIHHWYPTGSSDFPTSDDERINEALKNNNAVLVLGRPGTGKGSIGQRLAIRHCSEDDLHPGRRDRGKGKGRKDRKPGGSRAFVSSTHFSNDFLSSLEAATLFLGEPPSEGEDILDAFERALTNPNRLLVLGGIERLLMPAPPEQAGSARFRYDDARPPLPVGVPTSREIERFFRVIERHAKKNGKLSKVVLTSSVQPVLGFHKRTRRAQRLRSIRKIPDLHLLGFSQADVAALPGFARLTDANRWAAMFHHALRGHSYATLVASRALENLPADTIDDWLQSLVSHMTSFGIQQRAEVVIGAAVKAYLQSATEISGVADEVLKAVSLCTTPVAARTIATMLGREYTADSVDAAVEELLRRSLLLAIVHDDESPRRYTAHTVVRAFVLHGLGGLPDLHGEPQRMELSAFTKEADAHGSGGGQAVQLARDFFANLIEEANATGAYALQGTSNSQINDVFRSWRALVRAAYGLVRCRWSIVTVGRVAEFEKAKSSPQGLSHFDAYQKRLAQTVNTMRDVLTEHLWYDEDLDEHVHSRIGPLYSDELAWIYNELGMVSFCKGSLADAYALFRVGQDVNRNTDNGFRGHRWCQSELNLAVVQLERARLHRAETHLTNVLRAAEALRDSDLVSRSLGFLALVYHLRGDYESAVLTYEDSLERLRTLQNRRGLSIFLRHYGDLLRTLDRLPEAFDALNESVMTAEAGSHCDLLWYSRTALANLKRDELQGTSGVLEGALAYARSAGLPKLEADVFKVRSHFALVHGETEAAGKLAIRCLRIGSAFGMRLRVTSALVLLGDVARRRGDADAARGLYAAANSMAMRQGYQSKAEEATNAMLQLGKDIRV